MEDTRLDSGPQRTATRGITRLGWVVFVIGAYVLATVFLSAGLFAGLVLRWPRSWADLAWALPALRVLSVALAVLIMGVLVRLRGWRQWLVAFAAMSVLVVAPPVVSLIVGYVQGLD